jgi:uncharacterized protein YndB with AHSA1/START domain
MLSRTYWKEKKMSLEVSENLKLQVTRVIKAKRARVFDAWTKPELMHLWFAPGNMTVPSASADPRVGGAYRVEMRGDAGVTHIVSGVYQEIVPNELLRFTWGWQGGPKEESLVTIVFKDIEGGTELTLTHERLDSVESRDKHQKGWLGCLENLAKFCEK